METNIFEIFPARILEVLSKSGDTIFIKLDAINRLNNSLNDLSMAESLVSIL